MKTSELTGAALDWAVAEAEYKTNPPSKGWVLEYHKTGQQTWPYSTAWEWGGPIIEREWLHITPWPNESDEDLRWQCKQHDSIDCVTFGPTPLIAAMRCFVASRLGDAVEVPEALKE